MRKNVNTFAGILMAALVLLALSACPSPEAATYTYNSDFAQLDRITVAGEIADMGYPAEQWAAASAGVVYLDTEQTAASGNTVTVRKRDKAAVARFAKTADRVTAPVFTDTAIVDNDTGAAVGAVNFGEFVWVEVTSPNKDLVYIYSVEVKPKEPKVASLTVNGGEAVLGTPAATWNDPALVSGSVTLLSSLYNTANQIGKVVLEAAAQFEGMTLAFDVRADNYEPQFSDKVAYTMVQPTWIWVQCTAEDGSKLVYRIAVVISETDNELLNPRYVFSDTVNADTQWTNLNNLVSGETFEEAVSVTLNPAASLGFTGTADIKITIAGEAAAGAKVEYGTSAAGDVEPASWNTGTTLTGLSSGNYIGIKVTAQNGDVRYYKLRVANAGESGTDLYDVFFGQEYYTATRDDYVVYNGTDERGEPVYTLSPFYYVYYLDYEFDDGFDGGFNFMDPFEFPLGASLNPGSEAAEMVFGRGANWTTDPATWVDEEGAKTLFTSVNDIKDGAYAAVKVTSQDELTETIHKVYAYTKAADMTGLKINGADVANFGTSGDTWNTITDGAVTVDYVSASTGIKVVPSASIPGTKFNIAVTPSDGPAPTNSGTFGWRAAFTSGLSPRPTPVTVADGNYLWIRTQVAGTNGFTKMYRLKVTVTPSSNDYTINSFSIGGVAEENDDGEETVTGDFAVTLGAPAEKITDVVKVPVTLPANMVRPLRFNVTASEGALVEWQNVRFGSSVSDTNWSNGMEWTNPSLNNATFYRDDTLYLRITLGDYVRYYAFTINCPIVMDSLNIGGMEIPFDDWKSGETWNDPRMVSGLVEVENTLPVGLTAQATGNGTAQYAVTNSARVTPVFSNSGDVDLSDGCFLYIKITQEGKSAIYRVKFDDIAE